jgi:RNA polymerase sigma-70 factor (ECF subfamily)
MSLPSDADVAAAHQRAKATWSVIALSRERFSARASELQVSQAGLETWAGDFYLACAAGDADPAAIRIIDQSFIARLAGRIRRLGGNTDDASDVLQAVRERLFSGTRPRIRAYDAGGPLEQWIKVVAIRTAIDRHRVESRARRVVGEPQDVDGSGNRDPAETLFKVRYRAEFATVLKTQIALLSERDRSVLRLHLLEGVSIDSIASDRGVHRVTVARWIWNAGEILLEGLQSYFKERYGMVPSECDSLAHLIRSQLSLDLPRLLTVGS